MATITNICGFDSQSEDEFPLWDGILSYSDTIRKNDTGASIALAGDISQGNWIIVPETLENTTDGGSHHMDTFDLWHTDDFDNAPTGWLWKKVVALSGSAQYHIGLFYDTLSGGLYLKNSTGGDAAVTITHGIAPGQWNHIEVFWVRQNSGLAQVRVNGNLVLTATSDFQNATTNVAGTKLHGSESPGQTNYFDNLILYSNITNRNQRIPKEPQITLLASGHPDGNDQGDPLTSGAWDDLSAVPPSDSNPVTLNRTVGSGKEARTTTSEGTLKGIAGNSFFNGRRVHPFLKVGGRFQKSETAADNLQVVLASSSNTTKEYLDLSLSLNATTETRFFGSYTYGPSTSYTLGLANGCSNTSQILTCTSLLMQVVSWEDPETSGTVQVI